MVIRRQTAGVCYIGHVGTRSPYDHCPSLAEGVDHVRTCLDLDIPYGGTHAEMGTHNHVLRLGDDVFLEVIAADPAAAVPGHARWFGLDDAASVRSEWESGRRLRAWVARTDDIDGVLARHGGVLGRKTRVSRGDRSWLFAVRPDGSLPAGGAVPSVIDWEKDGSPAQGMIDLGARLLAFEIEHVDPEAIRRQYHALGVQNAPAVRPSGQFRCRATIHTLTGPKALY